MNKRERDIFDDLDALKAQRPEMERAPVNKVAVPRGIGGQRGWEKISCAKAKRIGGITCVYVHLIREMTFSHNELVPATAKTTGCNCRRTRVRALRQLEKLGLAVVECRGSGVAPMVRLT
jgi:hypothetical protein